MPFLPTLHVRGMLQTENVTSIDHEIPYIPGRDKEAMLFPSRNTDWSKKFATIGTNDRGNYFGKPVGQEFDQYDPIMKKYMTSRERGLIKPRRTSEPGVTTHIPKESMYLDGSNGVFSPTRLYGTEITPVKPLNDRSNTPRGAAREISLDRLHTNKRWLYNKSTQDQLNPAYSALDIKRGERLRKITRNEDK